MTIDWHKRLGIVLAAAFWLLGTMILNKYPLFRSSNWFAFLATFALGAAARWLYGGWVARKG